MAASSSGTNRFTSQFSPRSSHSRSASWSHTRGDGQIDLSSHLQPITTVIRELGLGFGQATFTNRNSLEIDRSDNPSNSVFVDIGERGDERGISRVFSRHGTDSTNGSQSDTNGNDSGPTSTSGNGTRANGDRMEFQGAIKWIERSVPFLLLLLSRIMWDHRLGMIPIIIKHTSLLMLIDHVGGILRTTNGVVVSVL